MNDGAALYLGLMSGTSLDGLDIALCRISSSVFECLQYQEFSYPESLKADLQELAGGDPIAPLHLMTIDQKLGNWFAKQINVFLTEHQISASQIEAIGLHGQTIAHFPNQQNTWQIGNPAGVCALTKIDVVYDFRRMDMAAGGQGAPLASGFHQRMFYQPSQAVGILNIGGIANLTVLPKEGTGNLIGFDTGPGNGLMDRYLQETLGQQYDLNGNLAQSGSVIPELLKSLMADPYFQLPAPKSTGTQYFSWEWLNKHLQQYSRASNQDLICTLAEFSAQTIANSLDSFHLDALYICGGGAFNTHLVQRIEKLSALKVCSTESLGIKPDRVEACTFAWLAFQHNAKKPANVPSVTGASEEMILGSKIVAT